MHPFRGDANKSHSEKERRLGLARGGEAGEGDADRKSDLKMIADAVHAHEKHDHPGKPLTKLKRKDGGATEGDSAKPRNDRKSSKGSHVNVIIAPQNHPAPPMGGPMGAMGPMGLGAPPVHPAGLPAAPPPPPMMGPPGGPPGLPPGMPPGMPPRPMPVAPGGIPPRAAGGRVGYKRGGSAMGSSMSDNDSTEETRHAEKMGPHARKDGGGVLEDKTPKGVGVGEVGAGGGLGRLAKVKAYGDEADKGEGKLKRGGRAC